MYIYIYIYIYIHTDTNNSVNIILQFAGKYITQTSVGKHLGSLTCKAYSYHCTYVNEHLCLQ